MQEPKRLPDAEKAYVPKGKIEAYLLSPTHAVGRTKAAFFAAVGFSASNPNELKRALLSIAQQGEVTYWVATEYGTKYVVDGWLQTPTGRQVAVRTVWIVEWGQSAPRLVTAYPLEEQKG
ncbi:MAG: DUF6883 domain-containing protein [Armatimonadota bacterium]